MWRRSQQVSCHCCVRVEVSVDSRYGDGAYSSIYGQGGSGQRETHHEDVQTVARDVDGCGVERVALEDERTDEEADGVRPPPLVAAPGDGDQPEDDPFAHVAQRYAGRCEDGVLIERGAVLAVLDDGLPEPIHARKDVR